MVGVESEYERLSIRHLYGRFGIFSPVETEKTIMALHTIIALVPPVPVFIGAWQELVLPIPTTALLPFHRMPVGKSVAQ